MSLRSAKEIVDEAGGIEAVIARAFDSHGQRVRNLIRDVELAHGAAGAFPVTKHLAGALGALRKIENARRADEI